MQGTPPGATTSDPEDTRRPIEREPALDGARDDLAGPSRDTNPPVVETADESRIGDVELVEWLDGRGPRLLDLWIHELRARDLGHGTGADEVVEMFAAELVRMLPLTIGPHRDQVLALWDRSAELYGAIAAKRGLAAGEAIDEIHILRELVIRELYRDPPANCSIPLSLREFLRLNRSLDRAVTHTSVGHTDALFFQFFEGDGAGSAVLSGEDVADEAGRQLREIREELDTVLHHAAWSGTSGARES